MFRNFLPSLVFAAIIVFFELMIEIEEGDKIVELLNNDIISANLIMAGIAGAVGILVYAWIESYLNIRRSEIHIVESIAIVVATLLIVFIYRLYKQKEKDSKYLQKYSKDLQGH